MQVGGQTDVPSTLSRTSFWSRPAALRASHMYVPESAGCARASCSVWVPAGGGGVSPSHQQLAAPRLPARSPQSWTPSLSLPTRQEEGAFAQGEGLAVLVPCDLGARVSTDVAGEGDAAVEGGGDLL